MKFKTTTGDQIKVFETNFKKKYSTMYKEMLESSKELKPVNA